VYFIKNLWGIIDIFTQDHQPNYFFLQRVGGMSIQTYPPNLHSSLTTALHANDYRPIAGLIHAMFLKKGHRGSLEKYITYDFTEYLQRVRDSLHEETQTNLHNTLEYFLIELYKASARNKIIEHIVYCTHVL